MPMGVKVSTAVMALSMAAVTILRMASLCRLADGTTFFMMFSSVRVLLGYPTIPGMGKPGNRECVRLLPGWRRVPHALYSLRPGL